MSKENILKNCEFFTIEEITTPKQGYTVYVDHWWSLHTDGRVIIYNKYHPQCNRNRSITEDISKRIYSGNVVFLSLAYVEPDCRV